MEVGYFTLNGEYCYDDVCLFINDNWDVGYEKDLGYGKLFFIENFSLMANNDLMIAINVQKVGEPGNECEIEVIAGGGGSGLLKIRFGNESRRVDKFFDIISRFCRENGFSISEFRRL